MMQRLFPRSLWAILIGLLCPMAAASTFAQTKNSCLRTASIEIQYSKAAGQWLYLQHNPFFDLPTIPVDSALADSVGIARFRFVPDPKAWYKVVLGGIPIMYGNFVENDSIIVHREPKAKTLGVVYDRIGAYTEENRY